MDKTVGGAGEHRLTDCRLRMPLTITHSLVPLARKRRRRLPSPKGKDAVLVQRSHSRYPVYL